MPERMAATTGRARAAERAAVDHLEAVLLAPRIGQDFDGVVTDVRDGRATVQIADPAVVAPLDGDGIQPGTRVRARLTDADPAATPRPLRPRPRLTGADPAPGPALRASGSPRAARGRRRRRRGWRRGRG